jgi:hypothetical protein
MITFDDLPGAWFQLLTQQLPVHLKLALRCCSSKLQQHVDQAGVGLVLLESHVPTVALQLTSEHLTSLNTVHLRTCTNCRAAISAVVCKPHTNLPQQQSQQQSQPGSPSPPPLAHDSVCRCQAAVARAIRQLEGGLPSLRVASLAPLQQPELLAAVLDTRPPVLRHLKLIQKPQAQHKASTRGSRAAAAAAPREELQQQCSVLQKLPGQAVTADTPVVTSAHMLSTQLSINFAVAYDSDQKLIVA